MFLVAQCETAALAAVVSATIRAMVALRSSAPITASAGGVFSGVTTGGGDAAAPLPVDAATGDGTGVGVGRLSIDTPCGGRCAQPRLAPIRHTTSVSSQQRLTAITSPPPVRARAGYTPRARVSRHAFSFA